MTLQAAPNAGYQVTRKGRYTGYTMPNQGGTAVSADIARGAVLQCAAGQTTGSAIASDQVGGTPTADNAYSFCQPTVGYKTPFGVVAESTLVGDITAANVLEGVTANLRTGGTFDMTIGGYCRALVKASAVLVAGMTLLEPVDGQFYLQPCSRSETLYSNVADSAAVTSTTVETAFDKSYTLLANSLNVGDLLEIEAQVLVVGAANTDTLVIKLYIGTQEVIATGVPDTVTNDVAVMRCVVQIRTIGASGTYVAWAQTVIATPSAAAGAADIPSGDSLGSTAINTTTTNAITVKATWSVADSVDSAVLKGLVVKKVAASSLGQGPIAVAMESKTVGSSAALSKVLLMQPLF